MGHNLFKNGMAFVGEVPWHGLGQEVPPTVPAAIMCSAAGLDWKVEKKPAPGARMVDQRKQSYDRYLIYRDATGEEKEPVALGMVGSGYEPLQNWDAFTFFEPFIEAGLAQFQTAGALGNGERVWVQAKLKDHIVIAKEDVLEHYLLLSNSHNGAGAVTVRFTPIRVVCQNTLNLAIEDGGRSAIAVRHTRNINRYLAKAQANELGLIIDKVFADAKELFVRMTLRSLKAGERETILEGLFPRTRPRKDPREKSERWRRIEAVLDDADVTPRETAGSLWGLYNAVIRDEDYRVSREAGADARLERVWFGSGEDLKIRTLEFCRSFLKAA